MLLEVDTDREVAHGCQLAFTGNFEGFLIHPGFHRAIDSVQKILAVVSQVKSQQIVSKQAVQQFFPPGEGAEGFPVGPWKCPNWPTTMPGQRFLSMRSSSPKW